MFRNRASVAEIKDFMRRLRNRSKQLPTIVFGDLARIDPVCNTTLKDFLQRRSGLRIIPRQPV